MDLKMMKSLGIAFDQSVCLCDYTTFRLGGPVKVFIEVNRPDKLLEVVGCLIKSQEPFIVIGGGSNLIVSDEGLPCAVIRYFSDQPFIEVEPNALTVAGCTQLDDLVSYAAQHGLEGLNFLSGIPGTVAGAVAGNAGAFGQQVCDSLLSVCVVDRQGQSQILMVDDCGFSYRDSLFKRTDDVIVGAKFFVMEGHASELLKNRQEILSLRREKHPDWKKTPCAGSIFRNIEANDPSGRRQSAGFLLDEAGAKSWSVRGARIYAKHANIVINDGNATAQDVYDLILMMAKAVKERFQIDLIREVRMVGSFAGMPPEVKSIIW